VLDPFAGVGSTAKAGIPLGRKIVCVDQNRDYVEIIKAECGPLRNGATSGKLLDAVHGDSRDLKHLKDETVSLVVTSPPYWNKADYGEGDANLGSLDQYKAFFRKSHRSFRSASDSCNRVESSAW